MNATTIKADPVSDPIHCTGPKFQPAAAMAAANERASPHQPAIRKLATRRSGTLIR